MQQLFSDYVLKISNCEQHFLVSQICSFPHSTATLTKINGQADPLLDSIVLLASATHYGQPNLEKWGKCERCCNLIGAIFAVSEVDGYNPHFTRPYFPWQVEVGIENWNKAMLTPCCSLRCGLYKVQTCHTSPILGCLLEGTRRKRRSEHQNNLQKMLVKVGDSVDGKII